MSNIIAEKILKRQTIDDSYFDKYYKNPQPFKRVNASIDPVFKKLYKEPRIIAKRYGSISNFSKDDSSAYPRQTVEKPKFYNPPKLEIKRSIDAYYEFGGRKYEGQKSALDRGMIYNDLVEDTDITKLGKPQAEFFELMRNQKASEAAVKKGPAPPVITVPKLDLTSTPSLEQLAARLNNPPPKSERREAGREFIEVQSARRAIGGGESKREITEQGEERGSTEGETVPPNVFVRMYDKAKSKIKEYTSIISEYGKEIRKATKAGDTTGVEKLNNSLQGFIGEKQELQRQLERQAAAMKIQKGFRNKRSRSNLAEINDFITKLEESERRQEQLEIQRKKDFKRIQKDAVEFLTNKGKEAKQARAAVDIQKIARGRKVRNQTNLIKAEQNSMGIEDKLSKRAKDTVRFVETPGLDKNVTTRRKKSKSSVGGGGLQTVFNFPLEESPFEKKTMINKNEGAKTEHVLNEDDFEVEPPPKRNVKELFKKAVKKQIVENRKNKLKAIQSPARTIKTPQASSSAMVLATPPTATETKGKQGGGRNLTSDYTFSPAPSPPDLPSPDQDLIDILMQSAKKRRPSISDEEARKLAMEVLDAIPSDSDEDDVKELLTKDLKEDRDASLLKKGLDQFKGNVKDKAYALLDVINNDAAVQVYEHRDRVKGKKISSDIIDNMKFYYSKLGGKDIEILNSPDAEKIKRAIEALRRTLLLKLEVRFPNITKHQTPKDKRHSDAITKAGNLKGKVSAEDYMSSIRGGAPRTPRNKRDSTATVIGAYTPGTTPGSNDFSTPNTSEITAGGKRAFADALSFAKSKGGASQRKSDKVVTASGNQPRVENRKLGTGARSTLKKADNEFLNNPLFDMMQL